MDVGIVTNNFHVFRGVMLARHAGFENACGIAARSNIYFQPNNLVREFFGVMKDLVCGNTGTKIAVRRNRGKIGRREQGTQV